MSVEPRLTDRGAPPTGDQRSSLVERRPKPTDVIAFCVEGLCLGVLDLELERKLLLCTLEEVPVAALSPRAALTVERRIRESIRTR